MKNNSIIFCGAYTNDLKQYTGGSIVILGNVPGNIEDDLQGQDIQVYYVGSGEKTEHLQPLQEKVKTNIEGVSVFYPGLGLEEFEELPISVDIIVSEEAPSYTEPYASRPEDFDYPTWVYTMSNRNYLSFVFTEINWRWWFYGKYSTSYSGHCGEKMYRCVPPGEIFELPLCYS